MNFLTIFFGICTILAVTSAIITVTSKSPIKSAISLIFHFFMLAAIYLTLNAQFIAVIQILVYAGAIMVLIVFVIMLLNVGQSDSKDSNHISMPISFVLGIVFLIQIVSVILIKPTNINTSLAKNIEFSGNNFEPGSVELLGAVLYNDHIVAVLSVGMLLTAALIGAVVLAKKRLR